MKLTIPERITLQNTLPVKGNYMAMVAVKEIRANLDPTEAERTEHKIVINDNRIDWNPSANTYEAEIEFAKSHIALIDEALQQMNKENGMSELHISLYQKFCLNAESV